MLEPDKNSSVDRESDNYSSGDNNSDVDLLKSSTEEDKLPSLKQSTKIYKPTQLQQNNPKKEISTTTSSEKNKLNISTSNRGNLRDATGYTSAPTSSKANTSILPRNAKIANPQAATAATPARSISAKREPSRPPNVATAASRPQNVESNTAVPISTIAATSPAEKSKSKTPIPTTPSSTEELQPPQSRLSLPPSNELPQASQIATTEESSSDELSKQDEDIILNALPSKTQTTSLEFKEPIKKMINIINNKPIKDYILIQAAKKIIKKSPEIQLILSRESNITKKARTIGDFTNLKHSLNGYFSNPGSRTSLIPEIFKNHESFESSLVRPLSRPSSAASSRQSLSRPLSASQSLSFESDCTILGKTLMSELSDMRKIASGLKTVPEMCKFFLSNKRYCYHIMRTDVNDYLKQLIKYLYIDKSLRSSAPTVPIQSPPNIFDNLSNFPDTKKVFDTITDKLEIPQNSKKNVLVVLKKTNVSNKIPRILSTNYVLVSFMITSENKQTIESVSIPENDPSEYVLVTVMIGSKIMLNYQKMLFPPDITTGETFKKIQSKPQDLKYINGGKKTIRKYRKHNRNKTTRNYK